jgi:hypothetical protein
MKSLELPMQRLYICIVCLVTLKIGKTIPKKSTGYQIYFLIIFILRTDVILLSFINLYTHKRMGSLHVF